jgi:hypothetical protein
MRATAATGAKIELENYSRGNLLAAQPFLNEYALGNIRLTKPAKNLTHEQYGQEREKELVHQSRNESAFCLFALMCDW